MKYFILRYAIAKRYLFDNLLTGFNKNFVLNLLLLCSLAFVHSLSAQNPGSLDDDFTEVGNNNFNYNETNGSASSTGCLDWGVNGYNSGNGGNIWFWSNGSFTRISNNQAQMRINAYISAGADLSDLAGDVVTLTFDYGATTGSPLQLYFYSDYTQPPGTGFPGGTPVIFQTFTNSGSANITIPDQYLTSGFGIRFQHGSGQNLYISVDNVHINTTDGCPPIPEICSNGIDDDADGFVDCDDPDCGTAPCPATLPTNVDLNSAMINGTFSDATSGLNITYTRSNAGTASTAGTANDQSDCDGVSTFIGTNRVVSDQNNLAAPADDITSADVLNNYIVDKFVFDKPTRLIGSTFEIGDLDFDHFGFSQNHDVVSVFVERNGVLTAATVASMGSGVKNGETTVGTNPTDGTDFIALSPIPAFYNSEPITSNSNAGAEACSDANYKVTFELGCDPVDAIHILYWNGIDNDITNGGPQTEMVISYKDFRTEGPSFLCVDPDLAVTKTVSPTTVQQGDTATFTMTATAVAGDFTAVNICDNLPSCVTLQSAVGDGSYDGSNWMIDTILSGQSKTIDVKVIAVGVPGDCENIATYLVPDADATNNADTAVLAITPGVLPDICLELSKTATPTIAGPGDAVTIVTTLQNKDVTEGTNVQVKDLVPVGMTLDSFTPSVGTYNPTTGIWTIPSIAGNSSETLTLNLTVN